MAEAKDDFVTVVTGTKPESNIDIKDDKKVDVMIALYVSLRSNIVQWNDRAYRATAWSIGLSLAVVMYWITHSSSMPILGRFIFAVGIFMFGSITQRYLLAIRQAHKGTGRVIDRVQATLKLCDKSVYIQDALFFGYSGKYLAPGSIKSLQFMHCLSFLFCIVVVIIF